MKDREQKLGIIYAGFSYLLWGILPVYWKFLNHVKADEILATRIFWAFIFMIFVLLFSKKWQTFIQLLRGMLKNKKQSLALITASLLISLNWFLYIWAVNSERMIETSLGYYINPLVSVLLGMIVLKERLTLAQCISFFLAATGVLVLTVSYGQFPWISLTLALSFGLYGLAKKMIQVESAIGLTLETLVITPIALAYLVFLFIENKQSFLNGSLSTDFLMMGAGAVTALPLLYFAKGAQKIPLSMLGFLQYIAPTITLILGVFVYNEQFTKVHLLSFSFIWLALTIFTLSKTKIFSALALNRKKGKSLEI